MWFALLALFVLVAAGPTMVFICGLCPCVFRFIKQRRVLFEDIYVPFCWYPFCFWRRSLDWPRIYHARQHALYFNVSEAAKMPHNANTGELLRVSALPSQPPGSMRFVCVSDTHTLHRWLQPPPGDVLIHAGDILLSSGTCNTGQKAIAQLRDFRNWLSALPYKHKISIGGNHDQLLSNLGVEGSKDLLGRDDGDGCSYLCSESFLCTKAGAQSIIVHASPYSKTADHGSPNNAFQGKAKGCFPSELPRDVSVLVTHGPPQRIFQNKKKTAGCPELTALLDEASAPAVHVCGHLHRAHGVYTHRAPSTSASIVVVNASTVSGALSPVNPPIVFDIC